MKPKQKINKAIKLIEEKRRLDEGFEQDLILDFNDPYGISLSCKIDYCRENNGNLDDIGDFYISKKNFKKNGNLIPSFLEKLIDDDYFLKNWKPFVDFQRDAKTWKNQIKDFLNSFEKECIPVLNLSFFKYINFNDLDSLKNTIKDSVEYTNKKKQIKQEF